MNRVFVLLLGSTIAAVACGNDSPAVPNVVANKSETKPAEDAGTEKSDASTPPKPASSCTNWKDDSGTTSYGCCLPTGRCGYYVVDLNACVEAAQIGADESNVTCAYTGGGSGEDDDEHDDDEHDDDEHGDAGH